MLSGCYSILMSVLLLLTAFGSCLPSLVYPFSQQLLSSNVHTQQFPARAQLMGTPKPVRTYDFVGKHRIRRITRDAVELSFNAYNQTLTLHLLPNHQLVHQNAVVEIHDLESSQTPIYMPILSSNVFDGKVIKTLFDGSKVENGWARITFNTPNFDNGEEVLFDGVIQSGSNMLHVKQIKHYKISQRQMDIEVASPFSRQPDSWGANMMVFTDEAQAVVEERWGPVSVCQASDSDHPLNRPNLNDSFIVPPLTGACELPDNSAVYNRYLDDMRLNDERRLFTRAAAGCPQTMQVLPMGVAADCSYVQAYGSTGAALAQILSNWNQASKIYESTFNVQLAVVKVSLQQSCTPTNPQMIWNQDCTSGYTITTRLSDFSNWRGNIEGNGDGIGLWHLMTKCSTQPAVGVAWLNMLCSNTATKQTSAGVDQFVSGTGVSSIVPVEWKVVAHEIGHNFGALHDCMSSTCPCSGPTSSCQCTPCSPQCDCRGQFIMHPLDNAATSAFSPASIESICSQYPTIGKCLKAPGTLSTISTGICGNSVKEADEECDCGLPADCAKDPCCDGTVCKLKAPAKCDDLNDSCCSNCQLKTAGTVCHPSLGSCDTTMTCNGLNATCPTNSSIADGTSCNTSSGVGAQCASGVCTNRDLQCKGSGSVVTVSACPSFSSSCALFCQNSAGNCFLLNGYFLDGTPCGYTGKCSNGACVGGNPAGFILEWIQSYPQYAVPLIVIGALLLIAVIYSCCRCCCSRPRKPVPQPARQSRSGSLRPSATTLYPPMAAPPPPFQPAITQDLPPYNPSYSSQPQTTAQPNGWVNPAAYNGFGEAQQPNTHSSGNRPPTMVVNNTQQ
ncbi:hypothetical protein, variant 1 [Batrachochytrium dendrobatidis JEL423]|uniref:Disintegrin and metalloproteinase domain-containing protein B n=1 Tax=Batrachochytrium dendrobatidis (strain JEL423) TaxID=403673 RepID=A0A177WPZ5_BATDL|nr:hypothetical protein, variant 1 [Batrachochytrium dendrobatidis JEL423]